ncbi:MAG: fumarylacetoacetate hydrolase family protein [Bacteroidales bacterium]|nr:fumarylacetoacetate hydrolase family protein [Bacteroidales bacterium]
MKIICIGRNYLSHIREFKNKIPEKPVFFLKPETALLLKKQPFFYPDFSSDIHYELELVLKICKLGKNISARFAHKYYNEIATGIDFTARDIQQECIEKGLPWEISKSFDGAAAVGNFVNKDVLLKNEGISFSLKLNDNVVQVGNSLDMVFPFDHIVSYVSQFFTLKIGDLIFTGTPSGVGPVKVNDVLESYLENEKNLKVLIK